MPWIGGYEELVAYLRQFTNIAGDASGYDFNGAVHLMLVALDNPRNKTLDAERWKISESPSTMSRQTFF